MGPLQEFSIQPGTVQCFSVPDHANSAASLILRNLFQPGFKVWPHNDLSPFTALCFGRVDSLRYLGFAFRLFLPVLPSSFAFRSPNQA